jgi:hypothetical protein
MCRGRSRHGSSRLAFIRVSSAMATFCASSNRCRRAIVGAFKLGTELWFSVSTFTVNTRYRMLMLTMSNFQKRIPIITSLTRQAWKSITNWQNFDAIVNRYVDGKRSCIDGTIIRSKGRLIKRMTSLHYFMAII